MLRVRDEKRRMRQVEALRRQKESEDEGAAGSIRGDGGSQKGGGARVEMKEEQGDVFLPPKVAYRPRSPTNAALYSESSSSSSDTITSGRQVRRRHFLTASVNMHIIAQNSEMNANLSAKKTTMQ